MPYGLPVSTLDVSEPHKSERLGASPRTPGILNHLEESVAR